MYLFSTFSSGLKITELKSMDFMTPQPSNLCITQTASEQQTHKHNVSFFFLIHSLSTSNVLPTGVGDGVVLPLKQCINSRKRHGRLPRVVSHCCPLSVLPLIFTVVLLLTKDKPWLDYPVRGGKLRNVQVVCYAAKLGL